MDADNFEQFFQVAQSSDSFEKHLALKQRLLDAGTPEAMAFHFEAIARTSNSDLREVLASFFYWWGKPAAAYLRSRLDAETDSLLLGIGLQVMGRMQAPGTLALARKQLRNSDDFVREKACIVLGWWGSEADIERLAALQADDRCVAVRKWAATQQAHIHQRLPQAERTVAANLMRALQHESSSEVIAMNVYAAQMVLGRRFGLRDADCADVSPSALEEAKRKALVALRNRWKKLQ